MLTVKKGNCEYQLYYTFGLIWHRNQVFWLRADALTTTPTFPNPKTDKLDFNKGRP